MTKDNKTPESQLRAERVYAKKNPEVRQYTNKKGATKNFILKTATDEDIELVKKWIKDREDNGKQE